MIYDATCTGSIAGLSHVWAAGAGLYRTLDRLDASFGASSWEEALRWLEERGLPTLWKHTCVGDLEEVIAHYNEHRPHRSLGQRPPTAAAESAPLATVTSLRTTRCDGLINEYRVAA